MTINIKYLFLIVGIIIFVIIFSLLLYSQKASPPLTKEEKEIKSVVDRYTKAASDLRMFTVTLPDNRRCIPSNNATTTKIVDQGYTEYQALLTTYNTASTAVTNLFNNKANLQNVVTDAILTTLDNAKKDIDSLTTYLKTLDICKVFCEKTGTATWTTTTVNNLPVSVCKCNKGYKDPTASTLNGRGVITCGLTKNSQTVDTNVKSYLTAQTNYVNSLKLPTLSTSQGCLDWVASGKAAADC